MAFETICVLGLGYIGLPTASTFATAGYKVVGVDTNPSIVYSLQKGELHISEPGLSKLVKDAIQSKNLAISSSPILADAFIIAVPTPFYDQKKADLTFVRSAAESIVPFLRRGNLVVLESTSPPLTTNEVLVPILEKSGLKAGEDFNVVYSPERVLPGQILRELIENARVIGGINADSAAAGKELYQIFVKGEIITTTATTAEMVKLMENTYRDINIAIANEFARLADRFGIDVWEAIQIANLHPRVKILNPGPGVGGHCISVDPWFLVEAATDITPLIRTARQVNDEQPHFVVQKLNEILGTLAGKKITALGLAYKPDVDDLRESPAVEVVQALLAAGADVTAFEPFKPGFSIKGIRMASNLAEAISESDLLLLLVNHTQLKVIDPGQILEQTTARIVFDTVGGWNPQIWQDAGFEVHRLGRAD
ncbi:MAG: UDP-N-acetyl-D-mannosamine dehydrogenase [Chloroflexi bacterium 44-23]|nr:MAG: UDP-N-acetyl-D-mannosamine dehydrogenase [Chloroflexi bacterium 44-23]